MRVQLTSFFAQKAGNSPSEYEDAYWAKCREDEPSSLHLAVADGATETSFAGLWAKLLVRAYGRERLTANDLSTELDYQRSIWRRVVGRKQLTWYAEEKVRLGAFSSLLGLTLVGDRRGGEWDVLAVGDSCLFHIRGDELLLSFPVDNSKDFTSRPSLLSSVRRSGSSHDALIERSRGHWKVGDTFYLMTDALACWFLKRWELRSDPLDLLRAMNTQHGFETWVSDQRRDPGIDGTPLLKNDDVSLVACTLA